MTHKKSNVNVIWIVVVLLVILWGIFYFVLAGGNKNNATTSSYSCPMKNTQWGGCAGWATTPTTTPTTTTTTTNIDTTASYETVNVGHTAYALVPETVTLVAGKNYKLIITPTEDGGWCMNNMTIAGLDSNVYPVKKGVPVTIVINNAKAGMYEVVCGNMGMHQGNIVIQ